MAVLDPKNVQNENREAIHSFIAFGFVSSYFLLALLILAPNSSSHLMQRAGTTFIPLQEVDLLPPIAIRAEIAVEQKTESLTLPPAKMALRINAAPLKVQSINSIQTEPTETVPTDIYLQVIQKNQNPLHFTNTTSTQNTLDLDQKPSRVQSTGLGVLSNQSKVTKVSNDTDASTIEKTKILTAAAPHTTTPTIKPTSPTKVTTSVTAESPEIPEVPAFDQIKWQAANQGKAFLLKFGADWCVPCKMMEETTFQDSRVKALLGEHYLSLAVNVDDFDGYNLKQRYQVERVPTLLFFDDQANLIHREQGSVSASKMLDLLHQNLEISLEESATQSLSVAPEGLSEPDLKEVEEFFIVLEYVEEGMKFRK